MITLPTMKHFEWIASAQDDLSSLPEEVKRVFGFAIRMAQKGEKHPDAKPMKGFGSAGVLEIVENYDGDTYRAMYTVQFEGVIYVLDAFQKKSKSGRALAQIDINRIKSRLKLAENHYMTNYQKKTG